jgi:hypothetical protein
MLSKTPSYCIAVKMTLMVAVPASAEVMTKSPSPAQASPQTASPFQPISPPQTMQATPNLQLNCGYFRRNSNSAARISARACFRFGRGKDARFCSDRRQKAMLNPVRLLRGSASERVPIGPKMGPAAV